MKAFSEIVRLLLATARIIGESRRRWSRKLKFRGQRRTLDPAFTAVAVSLVSACGVAPQIGPTPDLPYAEASLGHPVELATGEIRSLDHPAFDNSVARDALWSPLKMLRKGDTGIFFLEPYDPNRIPVLFVHGIGGTPRDFRHMIELLDRSRFQAWVFNYPTGFRTKSVVALLHDLLKGLEQEHHFDTIFITGHSLGGLIAFSYAKSISTEGERVKLLITFSSPWMGLPWASVGTQHMLNPVPSWTDLSPGSEFLASLRKPTSQGAHIPSHFVFFSYERHLSLIAPESSDGVVPLYSQLPAWIQYQAEAYWGYNATHVGILSDDAALERYIALLGAAADHFPVSRPKDQPAS